MKLGEGKITIRPLKRTARDLMNYVEVHNAGYSTESWFETLQSPASRDKVDKIDYDATFVAEVKNRVVGFVDIKLRKEEADVENLVVLKSFRRKGVGSALLRAAEDFARNRRLGTIRAETPDEAKAANTFYEKAGFRIQTRAFLISASEHRELKLCADLHVHKVKDNVFWIPTENDLMLIKQRDTEIQTIGVFKVYVKKLERP